MPSTGVRIRSPPCSSFTANTSKTPYGIAGLVWLQVPMAVWMSAPRQWVQGMYWEQILNQSSRFLPESVALLLQLEQKLLVYFNCYKMCDNALAAKFTC
jgi:hypothetical protein